MNTKSIVKKLSVIFLAFILSASLLLQVSISVSAEETSTTATTTSEETVLANEETANEEEIFDHSTFSDEMLSAAIKRYQPPRLRNVDPYDDDPHLIVPGATLPYIGDTRVIVLYISFPNDTEDPVNQKHPEGDDEKALQTALTNLHDYYERASYEKLNISGDVIIYNAEKPRGEYSNKEALVSEALQALDTEHDFSIYDSNGDKMIDCIYLYIPHNTKDRWGDIWWSNCSVCTDPAIAADDIHAGSIITLNENVTEEPGRLTMVHETGHAMGFPDYYSYDATSAADPEYLYLTGSLTFDMMDNNSGDHNGFSKWIAGWLTDSDVTMVTVSEDGVTATRGGNEIGIRNEDGSITLDLSSFNNTDDISKTGGIIVVGNDLKNAVFSDYYMLQYDTFAGNQQLYYKNNPDTPLSSGFRVYRVQAKLTNGTSGSLIHNNTYGKLYNKLIELVDPDYKEYHFGFIHPYARGTGSGERYGCMFYAGDTLTPITNPSTNFQESINSGFTGIYMEFLKSEDTYGSVKIWYSDEAEPADIPLELELNTLEAVPGGLKVIITANQELTSTLIGENKVGVRIDQQNHTRLMNVKTEGNTYISNLYLDTDRLKKDSLIEIIFPEGSFILPGDKDSPRIALELPVSQDLAALTESAFIPGSEDKNNYGWNFSPIHRAEDGTYFFYSFSTWHFIDSFTVPIKYSFTSENPTEITITEIGKEYADYKTAGTIINALIDNDHTENAAIVPEGAQLGAFTHICDAVKIGDYYYVASYTEMEGDDQPQFAVSKLDESGNLIKQVTPAGNEFNLDYSQMERSRALIQEGPNNKLAVLLFNANQMKIFTTGALNNHCGTFFFDPDLNLECRLDNFSTGCGTWLDDGRYISFTQRVTNLPVDDDEEYFDRTNLISYDITDVIDPPQEIQYIAESKDGGKKPVWEQGSKDGLQINVDRTPDNDAKTCRKHFLGVAVDGVELTERKDYAVEFASVHITLLPSYLETLSEGTHTLTILFDDGQADIDFVIQKRQSASGSDTPDTGDRNQTILWIVLMALALCVVTGMVTFSLCKKNR